MSVTKKVFLVLKSFHAEHSYETENLVVHETEEKKVTRIKMEDIFETHSKCEFESLLRQLFACIHKINSDVKEYIQNDTDIEDWYHHMTTTLDSKRIKYAKAIERIIGEPGINYHACYHKDSNGLPCKINETNLKDVCNMLIDKEKDIFWKYIEHINRAAFTYKEYTPAKAPSKSDIQANIKARKLTENQSNDNSVLQAFYSSFKRLADDCDCKEKYSNNTDDEIKKFQTAWQKLCTPEFIEMCNTKNLTAVSEITQAYPGMQFTDIVSNDTWKTIHQLNSFAAVNQNIPTNMMGRIENMANVLAGNIARGKMDMSSINLNDIGKEVLSGCSEHDMQNFAQNIDKLLPALSNFQHMM